MKSASSFWLLLLLYGHDCTAMMTRRAMLRVQSGLSWVGDCLGLLIALRTLPELPGVLL